MTGNDREGYRGLFYDMMDGFAVHEIVLDAAGAPIDCRFLDINPAFERMTGLKAAEAIGKTMCGLFPSIRPVWIERYGKVAREGIALRFEEYNADLGKHFEVSAYRPAPGQLACVLKDISGRRMAEETHRLDEARLQSMVAVSQRPSENVQGLLDFALEEAIRLTGSKIGYIYTYNEERREFVLNNWSAEAMEECRIPDCRTVYLLEETGLWGEAVHQKRPILVNDYAAANPLKKGYPEGHVALARFLTVPVFYEGAVAGVIGVANKTGPYEDADVRQLTLLMDSVWKTVELRKAEIALRESELKLRAIFGAMTDSLIVLDDDGHCKEIGPGGRSFSRGPPPSFWGGPSASSCLPRKRRRCCAAFVRL